MTMFLRLVRGPTGPAAVIFYIHLIHHIENVFKSLLGVVCLVKKSSELLAKSDLNSVLIHNVTMSANNFCGQVGNKLKGSYPS